MAYGFVICDSMWHITLLFATVWCARVCGTYLRLWHIALLLREYVAHNFVGFVVCESMWHITLLFARVCGT